MDEECRLVFVHVFETASITQLLNETALRTLPLLMRQVDLQTLRRGEDLLNSNQQLSYVTLATTRHHSHKLQIRLCRCGEFMRIENVSTPLDSI